jgi:hypothetical protein
MIYCTQCGAAVEGRFCQQCGTSTSPPTTGAAPAAETTTVPAAAGKRNPLMWVLVGCLGVMVIAGLIAAATGLFVVQKARQAGIDPDLMERNPALAATKMLTAFNSDLEVLSVNEDRGIITVREKSTGKTVTMNFEDVKKGKIVFTDERGEHVDLEARGDGEGGSFTVSSKDGMLKAGSEWSPPDWLPVYSGARIESGVNSRSSGEESGAGYLSTGDSIEDVLKFYEEELRNDGFEVSRRMTAADGKNSVGTVTGESDQGKRHVNVVVTSADGASKIHLSFSVKN